MNRLNCQNQGMQRCGTQSMNSEKHPTDMRGTNPQQMRTGNLPQNYRPMPGMPNNRNQGCCHPQTRTPDRNMDCGHHQERNIERNMNCGHSQSRNTEQSMDSRCRQERNTENNMDCRSLQERAPERNTDCGCSGTARADQKTDWRHEVPIENRRQLLTYINEVSFGAYEALLYLDTHPSCPDGLRYFRENNEKRQFALKEYTRLYGPLNLDRVQLTCDTPSWEWVNQPWPWEGGAC